MKINIFKEIEISLFKPHLYYKLKDMSITRIVSFNFITALISIIFLIIYNFFIALFTKTLLGFSKYLDTFTLQNFTTTYLYMVFGLFVSSIMVTFLFFIISHFKKMKSVKYYYLFNYSTHSLLICALLKNFLGAFVIVFALAYCLMAVSHDMSELKN